MLWCFKELHANSEDKVMRTRVPEITAIFSRAKKQYHSGKGAAFQSGKTSIRSVLPPKGKEELSINLVGSVRQGRRYTDLVSSSVIRRRNTRASFAGELNVDGRGREADE
ncbi:hypothetical protein HZH66_008242 [Vespula vulgaris]|uniref:Uncharacterized protein n=1 Tax=Vespula vulgaris TaxID=7454 RepID=A0A834JUR4_VESVU|nr:hypothetical protein HZH66_008242 [Vespula vulgaris]